MVEDKLNRRSRLVVTSPETYSLISILKQASLLTFQKGFVKESLQLKAFLVFNLQLLLLKESLHKGSLFISRSLSSWIDLDVQLFLPPLLLS